jgi:hypothetical protein
MTTKIVTMTTSPKGRGIATGSTSGPIPLIKSELFVSYNIVIRHLKFNRRLPRGHRCSENRSASAAAW